MFIDDLDSRQPSFSKLKHKHAPTGAYFRLLTPLKKMADRTGIKTINNNNIK